MFNSNCIDTSRNSFRFILKTTPRISIQSLITQLSYNNLNDWIYFAQSLDCAHRTKHTSVSSANLKKICARIDRYLTSGRSHNKDGGQKVVVGKQARIKQNLQSFWMGVWKLKQPLRKVLFLLFPVCVLWYLTSQNRETYTWKYSFDERTISYFDFAARFPPCFAISVTAICA